MFSFLFLLAFSVLLFSGPSWAEEPAPTRNLLPVPSQVTWGEGSLSSDSGFSFFLQGARESRVENAVQRFIKRLEKRTASTFANPSAPTAGKATLVIDCKGKGQAVQTVREDESYTLEVTSSGAKLSAPNPLGVLRGLETLLQLVQSDKEGWSLPVVSIQDKPRFAWRGLLIDVCRHFEPVEVLKRNLDGLAEAKMNVFHWHLSENQGFRVESKKFPKLQEMGSNGKYYTQDEVREVVAYARDRGIRIVPEFDIPGHSTAWLVGYPELAAGSGPYELEKRFGIFAPTMDPTREEVYKFLDGFIGEMAGLFPDEYFHIGGDEVDGREWNGNPQIQAFMYKRGMKDNDDLQAYFNQRVLQLVSKHGKKMMGWDEILHPDLPKTIVVHSWRGADSLAEAAKQGYDGVLSSGYYLNHMRTAGLYYGIDPIPPKADLTEAQKAHVLGGEACMWGEYVCPETIDSRIWPRTLALAERFWSPATVKDTEDFYRRMKVESVRLEETGLTHNSSYLPMLKRLLGDQPVEPLEVLMDVMEPPKFYDRPRLRDYTTETSLDQLVDAARPESLMARDFKMAVGEYLNQIPFLEGENLKGFLQTWVANHPALEPLLKRAGLFNAANQSRDLAAISQTALEALNYLKSGKQAPDAWMEKADKVLERAQTPQAEIEIAVIPPIRKLVLAAGQSDKLKAMTPEEWNKILDDQVKAAKRRNWE